MMKIPVVVAAMVAALLPALAGTVGATPATAATATTQVKVFDWNIAGGEHLANVEQVIQGENPDIITLQEVHDDSNVMQPGGGYGVNDLAALQAAFPQYIATLWIRADGDGQTDSAGHMGSAGNAILSKYPIVERGTGIMPNPGCSTTVDHAGKGDGCHVNRSFGGIKVNINGTDVRVYTTHFSVDTDPTGRLAQASWVASHLRVPPLTSPYLFTGDLNTKPGEPERQTLADVGIRDAWTDLYDNTGTDADTNGGPVANRVTRIDYLWASPGFTTTEIHHGDDPEVTPGSGVYTSDHLPMVGTFTVHSPAAAQAATASSSEGWANAVRYSDGSGDLRTCDDLSNANGVLGYIRNSAGTIVASGRDDHFGDLCPTVHVASLASSGLTVQFCRNNGGTPDQCVSKPLA